MRSVPVLAAALVVVISSTISISMAAQAPARKLQISFDNQGNVTLVAEGVTVNEILREWTRVGGSQFLGAEKLVSAPLPPIQFEGQPEVDVLKSILRSAAGYMIAPRATGSAGPSRVNAAIVATSTATASSSYSSTMSPAVPVVTPGIVDDGGQPSPEITQGQPVNQPPANRPASTGYAPSPAPISVPIIQPIGTVPQGGQTKPDSAQPPMGGATGRGGRGGGTIK